MADMTPRVNLQYLDNFTNQTVRLVGKVVQLRGEQAVIDAGGSITAHLTPSCHLTVGNAVEMIAKVNQDLSIKVLQSQDWGSNIDFAAVDAVVDATHRCKDIFYA